LRFQCPDALPNTGSACFQTLAGDEIGPPGFLKLVRRVAYNVVEEVGHPDQDLRRALLGVFASAKANYPLGYLLIGGGAQPLPELDR
jgi:hypothetical protein